MPLVTPNVAFTLSGNWSTGDSTSGAQAAVLVRGQSSVRVAYRRTDGTIHTTPVSGGSPLVGWTINLTSGAWGNSNAHVQVLIPSSYQGYASYYSTVTVVHDDPTNGNPALSETVNIHFDSVTNPEIDKHGFTIDQHGDGWIATNGHDGVTISKIGADLGDLDVRGSIAGLFRASLTWSREGYLYAIGHTMSTTPGFANHDQIYKSTDGGETFSLIPGPIVGLTPHVDIPSVTFPHLTADLLDGALYRMPAFYRTYNDGATWESLSTSAAKRPLEGYLPKGLTYSGGDDRKFWRLGYNGTIYYPGWNPIRFDRWDEAGVLVTVNASPSWATYYNTSAHWKFSAPYIGIDEPRGLMYLTDCVRHIHKSSDFGLSWVEL